MAVRRVTLMQILMDEGVPEPRLSYVSPYVRHNFDLQDEVDNVRSRYTPKGEDRSGYETKVREYLEENGYKPEHERPLIVAEENDVIHTRYPDFYLPEHKLYIEVNGGEGKPERDKEYAHKDWAYKKNDVNYVVLHKKDLASDKWKSELERMIKESKIQPIKQKSTERGWYAAIAAASLMFFLLV